MLSPNVNEAGSKGTQTRIRNRGDGSKFQNLSLPDDPPHPHLAKQRCMAQGKGKGGSATNC